MRRSRSLLTVSLLLLAALAACDEKLVYQGQVQPAFETPAWFRTAVFYQIFPRSFQDADGDGIGDFKGLLSRLDYLNDGKGGPGSLGVTGIWFTPVNASPSYHGYDATSYTNLNPQFGSMEDFERFTAEAKKRGVRVIIDLVLNHSSRQHPWFQGSRTGQGPFKNFYVWASQRPPGWGVPWGGGNSSSVWHADGGRFYYGCFWAGMPDLNHAEPAVRQAIKDAMTFWMGKGVAGFRLDAVRYLVETGGGVGQRDTRATHLLLQEYAAHLKKLDRDAVLVGEAWSRVEDVGPYFGAGNELDSAFNFDLGDAILSAVERGAPRRVLDIYRRMAAAYPARGTDTPFLRNHDQPRVAEKLRATDKQALAASVLLTLPGAPFLYYGEELGMRGSKPDENIRKPMQWSAAAHAGFTTGTPWREPYDDYPDRNVARAQADRGSLWHHYRALVALRAAHPELARGRFTPLADDAAPAGLLAYKVAGGGRTCFIAHNLGAAPGTVRFDGLTRQAAIAWKNGAVAWDGSASVTVPAGASVVFVSAE